MIEGAQEPINFWCRRISFSYLQGSYPKEPFWTFDADNCSASFVGTEKAPIGELKFKAHRPYGIPNTITVSRHNGEWHVSFNYAVANLSSDLEPMT
jgi:hypothetical protein